MGKLAMGENFWKAVEALQKRPLEFRKNEFSKFVESYKAKECSIEIVLMMAVTLGKKDGELWFREMISFDDRRAESEKLNQMNLLHKTKTSLNKVFLGTVTHC